MKIYIVGSGGVGGYFGAKLAKAGNDVTFIARGEHFNAINNHGLQIKSQIGDFLIQPAKVIPSIKQIRDPNLVLFTVKTYQTEIAAQELAKVVNENTLIISIQNGVENDTQIKKIIKDARIYPGLAYVISTKIEPGVIKQNGTINKIIFGERNKSKNKKLEEIAQMMRNAHIDATVSDDILRDMWKKFMFLIPFSGMTAVCRSDIGKIFKDPVAKELYERCLKEAIAVAQVLQITVEENAFENIMELRSRTEPNAKSSLLVDIENHRETEIETINGMLVKLAKKHNIDVPINEAIYAAIKLLR